MAIGAMILAAGRGERMRPLSDATPKPLLEAGGKPLIVWQIEALARAGFRDIVDQRRASRGAARRGARRRRRARRALRWSIEPEPLEAAGGIATALPLLPRGPALIVERRRLDDVRLRVARPARRARWRATPHRRACISSWCPQPALPPRGDFALARRHARSSTAATRSSTATSASTTPRSSRNFRAATQAQTASPLAATGSAAAGSAASATTAPGPTSARPTTSPRSTRRCARPTRHGLLTDAHR